MTSGVIVRKGTICWRGSPCVQMALQALHRRLDEPPAQQCASEGETASNRTEHDESGQLRTEHGRYEVDLDAGIPHHQDDRAVKDVQRVTVLAECHERSARQGTTQDGAAT